MDRLTGVWDGRGRRAHFIGIGGAGMSALAELLHTRRWAVSGSDTDRSAVTERLAALGIAVFRGHAAEHVAGAEAVVWSSAVREENPERAAAGQRGIPLVHRGELLGALMNERRGIAVAGSHGKTSTTALIGHLLAAGGLDPTVLVGGIVNGQDSGVRVGQGPLLVAEADESDGSFLGLVPAIAVITNVDREHLDHFGSYDALGRAFRRFASGARELTVICGDDPGVQAYLRDLPGPCVTYGFAAAARWSARDVRQEGLTSRFRVVRDGREIGDVTLPLPGRHYALNALAALAVADAAGIEARTACSALAAFPGVARRFSVVGKEGGVAVVVDYGHHPAEIAATLAAARAAFAGRLIVAFQAHRYTRTRDLLDEFAAAFDAADELVITPIYAAGEDPIPGVDGRRLAAAVRRRRPAAFVPELAQLPGCLAALARPGDVVILQGAGDIDRVVPVLRALLGTPA